MADAITITSVVMFDPEPKDSDTNFGAIEVTALKQFKLNYILLDGKNAFDAKALATARWDVSKALDKA